MSVAASPEERHTWETVPPAPCGIPIAESETRVDDRILRERLRKAEEALRKAELKLFTWDEARRQEVERCQQKVSIFRAALKALGRNG
jgi:hypothetical protein